MSKEKITIKAVEEFNGCVGCLGVYSGSPMCSSLVVLLGDCSKGRAVIFVEDKGKEKD